LPVPAPRILLAIPCTLPTAAQFTATLPAGRSLGGNVIVSKANAKALGFTGLDAQFVTSDLVNEYRMSTGVNGGDGQQASHWKDDA
jgi:hypothetical protein